MPSPRGDHEGWPPRASLLSRLGRPAHSAPSRTTASSPVADHTESVTPLTAGAGLRSVSIPSTVTRPRWLNEINVPLASKAGSGAAPKRQSMHDPSVYTIRIAGAAYTIARPSGDQQRPARRAAPRFDRADPAHDMPVRAHQQDPAPGHRLHGQQAVRPGKAASAGEANSSPSTTTAPPTTPLRPFTSPA